MAARARLPELSFDHFFTYDEVTAFVESLAAAYPEWVALSALGTSREGRAIHLLTITDPATGPAADKPAYVIHGNIHATELSGTHAALYTARQLLADRRTSGLLRLVAFHIVPRLNPDGAEFAVTTSGVIRSRTDRSRRRPNTLYQEDLNGDGLILTMRQEHPDGQFVADPQDGRLLIRRTRHAQPPFYRTLPEGMIDAWDGSDQLEVEGRSLDWNRNWSYDWRPEPQQGGAGDYPFSEVEMRALADFLFAHPSIYGVLGYHNGPAAVLRPPSTGSDADLDAGDVRIMQELAEIGAAHTGFPVVPVVKYHRQDERDVNLRGHFHNFGYQHLGLFVFEFELGMLLNSAGMDTEEIFAVRDEPEYEELMRRLLAWWDKQRNRAEIYVPWTPYDHPQLGRVEIGGLLRKYMAGPTLRDLKRIAAGTYRFTLEHAARCPRVVIEGTEVTRCAPGVYRIRARVANRGQLPTHITNRGRNLSRLAPVHVSFQPGAGVQLLSRAGHHALGHLGGLTDSRELEWFVAAGEGAETLCHLTVEGGTGGRAAASIQAATSQ